MSPTLNQRAVARENRKHGRTFYWRDGTLRFTPGTCPYPLRDDWSVKACAQAGDCGCVLGKRYERTSRKFDRAHSPLPLAQRKSR